MNPKTLKRINLILVILTIGTGVWFFTAWRENEALEKEHERISEQYYAFIIEGLKTMPSLWVEATHKMRTGETREFTLSVTKLGENDEVVVPPKVSVFHGDSLMYEIEYPTSIVDSIVHGATGERLYRLRFTAPMQEGIYKLVATAQTNRLSLTTDSLAPIKLGILSISKNDFEAMIADDRILAETYRNLTASTLDSLMKLTTTIDIQVIR